MIDLEKLPFIVKKIITKNTFLAIRQKIKTNGWGLLQILKWYGMTDGLANFHDNTYILNEV